MANAYRSVPFFESRESMEAIIDAFGWARLDETVGNRIFVSNAQSVVGPAVPSGVLRLVIEASVEHSDPLADHTLWMEHSHSSSGRFIGVQTPVLAVGSTIDVKIPLMRWLVMRPGDTLNARSAPATGAGNNLVLEQQFVDLPIGEYVRGL